ncbi:MAG: enoyl-CoA hydratase [Betaproteobacteria bacterium]|nr:enoyl-CoA hydratase [Betaproteobacteria bacterium]
MVASLKLREEGPIAWMTFSNLERHNAVSYEMWCEVPQAIAQFDASPEIRAIVLTGDGEKAFVSGADISEFEKRRGSLDASTVYNEAVDAAYAAVLAAKKPTLCNDKARFAMPAAKLGLGIRYESIRRLMEVLPAAHAADIVFTGRGFDGQEALRLGFVNRSVSDEDLDDIVNQYLEWLGQAAPLTVKAAKAAMRAWSAGEADDAIAAVRDMTDRCFASADYQEGRKAFAEKRKPQFRGA